MQGSCKSTAAESRPATCLRKTAVEAL